MSEAESEKETEYSQTIGTSSASFTLLICNNNNRYEVTKPVSNTGEIIHPVKAQVLTRQIRKEELGQHASVLTSGLDTVTPKLF